MYFDCFFLLGTNYICNQFMLAKNIAQIRIDKRNSCMLERKIERGNTIDIIKSQRQRKRQKHQKLIFIIYLARILCLSFILSSCHPVVLSYFCRSCGTLSYSLCFRNQTDQGDETEGLGREGLERER